MACLKLYIVGGEGLELSGVWSWGRLENCRTQGKSVCVRVLFLFGMWIIALTYILHFFFFFFSYIILFQIKDFTLQFIFKKSLLRKKMSEKKKEKKKKEIEVWM